MNSNTEPEKIIKEHRKWTQWIERPRATHLGNLVLTNRRLIFLHQIQSSPNVKDNIKRLADAPTETVLNYAFSLNGSNFQIPLPAIGKVTIGTFNWTPFPHVCLSIVYFDGKHTTGKSASFQFIRPLKQTIINPQLIVDIGWVQAINKAIKNTDDIK
jgi:hypothetical protein